MKAPTIANDTAMLATAKLRTRKSRGSKRGSSWPAERQRNSGSSTTAPTKHASVLTDPHPQRRPCKVASTTRNTALLPIATPSRSSGRLRSGFAVSWRNHTEPRKASAAIGAIARYTQRQFAISRIPAAMPGAKPDAAMPAEAQIPMTLAWRALGNCGSTSASEEGTVSAPHSPCTTRATSSNSMPGASPAAIDDTNRPSTPIRNTTRRP